MSFMKGEDDANAGEEDEEVSFGPEPGQEAATPHQLASREL